MNGKGGMAGFTLIEVMVALGVFALAVLALLSAQTQSLVTSGGVRDRALAQIVAENQMVLWMSQPQLSGPGIDQGRIEEAGMLWIWTGRIIATADPAISRIEIDVRRVEESRVAPDQGSGDVLASLTAFRRASP
ncbi:type II secretion system protein GspI [Iodidimonas nitroreducens]|uniref:Type II secretion system protein I n=1 Tax=Iodidimonas nitroreducens TaxID=1236968 RepID=A0A5A7N9V9_9PROT|nr:type II secretion system minor pseudopilin GspI [Iodidimonas nitroreducens]GAK33151.1 type II secretion system protein I [alpha proteobacterium Q-1]GER04250.1 type II secretion system protein GspI [Iodidimonas nitroreducens]